MRRKGFSTGWWWGRAFSPSGVGDGSEKKRSSDPQQGVSRGGCSGSAVFLCVIPCSSRSLLLCLCCNVLLLCVLLAGRARCWLAICAGRVLHGSHCNALVSHYPLQERSPRVLPLFHPCPSISPLPPSRCPSFLPAPLFTHTHAEQSVWIGLHLHFQNRWVQKKTVDLSLSFPTLCTHFGLSTAPSFLS